MREVGAREVVVVLVGWRPEQACRSHRLLALASRPDQVVAAEDLGNAQLGRLEVDALEVHDDVEDRVSAFDARAVGARPALIPAPGWIVVSMLRIGA